LCPPHPNLTPAGHESLGNILRLPPGEKGLFASSPLGAKWGKEGGHIGFDRHQPTEAERELVEKIAKDEPPAEIREAGQKLIETAEKRSAEDILH
jgi:hypothetical protein